MAGQHQPLIKAVSQIAEIMFRAQAWQDAAPEVLRLLGEAMQTSRAYLFQCRHMAAPECRAYLQFEWTAAGISSQAGNPELQDFSWQENNLLAWKNLLHEGRAVTAHIDELPAQANREHFTRQGIKSLLLVPVMTETVPWGFVGVDECQATRDWVDEEIETLHAVANILGAAIFRHRTERELRESNERFLLAEKAGRIGCWEWNIETGELVWSENIEPLFGFAEGKFQKTYAAFLECVHPEDRSVLEEAVSASLKGEKNYHCLHRIIWPDGSIRWMEESGEVSRDSAGSPVRMIGVVQDISRDIEINQALSASEQRFRDLVESTSDWIWEVDADGRYTYVSPKVEEVLGYRPDELIGKTPFDLMPPDEADKVAAVFARIMAGRASIQQLININQHRDGRQVILETSGVPIFSPQGDISGYRGIDRDISARMASELALKESQEIFRQLAEHVSEVFYVRDREGSFIYVSPSCHRLFGREIPVGEWTLDDLKHLLHPEDRDGMLDAIETQYEGVGLDREFRIILPGNELKWVWLRTFPIRNEQGEVYRIAGLVEDITTRKLAQELRLQQEREHRSTLIREVHHRIKNNLQSIIGLLRLQLGDFDELSGVLDRVIGQVQSIALMHGLQGQSGDMYLCELVHAIGEYNKSLTPDQQVLEFSIERDRPVVIREEDMVPIALIINELLTNAIKHNAQGNEKVLFSLISEDASATIRVENKLPDQGKRSSAGGLIEGVGLQMVNALMPQAGADFEVVQDEGKYQVTLKLTAPVTSRARAGGRCPEVDVETL